MTPALACLALIAMYFGVAWLDRYLKRTKPNRRKGLPAPRADERCSITQFKQMHRP